MGITDGTFICGLCGEAMTGCYLCKDPYLVNISRQIEKKEQDDREAELELIRQSDSIKYAASKGIL